MGAPAEAKFTTAWMRNTWSALFLKSYGKRLGDSRQQTWLWTANGPAPLYLEPDYLRLPPTRDGWGNPYRYACRGEVGAAGCTSFHIVSAGRDGVFQLADPWAYGCMAGAPSVPAIQPISAAR